MNEDGRDYQDSGDDAAGQAQEAEEVEHLHIVDHAIGAKEKGANRGDRHRADRVNKQAQQDVFHAAESDIGSPRQVEIAAESEASQTPQVLGDGSRRAQPAAEALAEEPRCSQKSNQQEHTGGVECRHPSTPGGRTAYAERPPVS